jgi:hypothetical protein
MRKYKEHPWKEDKIKCVILMKKKDETGKDANKKILKVFVTRNVEKNLNSEHIKQHLAIKDRFKYNLNPGMKMLIPRRVFMQALGDKNVYTFFTTPARGRKNLIFYDLKTNIKKEQWFDSDNKPCILYFRDGLFLKYERGAR